MRFMTLIAKGNKIYEYGVEEAGVIAETNTNEQAQEILKCVNYCMKFDVFNRNSNKFLIEKKEYDNLLNERDKLKVQNKLQKEEISKLLQQKEEKYSNFIYVVKNDRRNHKILVSENNLTFDDLEKANIFNVIELKQIQVIDYDKKLREVSF